METIDDIIEKELEQKSIEKEPTITTEISDADPIPKKTKKVRSQAQIEAFEKARIKRAENFEKRKLLKAQEKQDKKEIKTQIKEKVNNLTTQEIKDEIHKPLKKALEPPQHSGYGHYNHQAPTPIINNYYYNTPQPVQSVKKKGRKKKVVYVTDSEEEDEEIEAPKSILKQPAPAPSTAPPKPQPQPRVYKKPSLKYNFVN